MVGRLGLVYLHTTITPLQVADYKCIESSVMRVFRLKPAATHEELERLTAEYLAAGHEIHRYDARRRGIAALAHARERNASGDATSEAPPSAFDRGEPLG